MQHSGTGTRSVGPLSQRDIEELRSFYETGDPISMGSEIQAQTYDPRGGATYNPSTDARLTRLLGGAVARSRTDWSRMKRVLAIVADGPNGERHVKVLRRVVDPLFSAPSSAIRWPDLIRYSATARARGRALAESRARRILLEEELEGAKRRGLSPIAVATQVLELDRVLTRRPAAVREVDVTDCAHDAVGEAVGDGDAAFVDAVSREVFAVLVAAGEAYLAARAQPTSEDRRRERKAEENHAFTALLNQKKAAKAAARFEQRLARLRREKSQERLQRAS